MNGLTIVYQTSRKEPMRHWFFDSLLQQVKGLGSLCPFIKILLLDGHPDPDHLRFPGGLSLELPRVKLERPMSNTWQGPDRLTKEDWWAVSTARNTAIALCQTEYIAFVDDLSVLAPGWLLSAIAHAGADRIICGAYRKVKDLIVEQGKIVSYTPFAGGEDGRMTHVRWAGFKGDIVRCGGEWMFGCNLIAPVEAFLSINGYDERCNGLSFEDCITGIHLQKKGWLHFYNPRMLTIESEERHHDQPSAKRSDYGPSPNDKSHAILKLAQEGDGWAPNDFNGMTLRELRAAGGRLAGPRTQPTHEWFTGNPLGEL